MLRFEHSAIGAIPTLRWAPGYSGRLSRPYYPSSLVRPGPALWPDVSLYLINVPPFYTLFGTFLP
jgi:hypothetical protein